MRLPRFLIPRAPAADEARALRAIEAFLSALARLAARRSGAPMRGSVLREKNQ